MIERSRISVSQVLCMKKRKEFLRREGAVRLVKIQPKVRTILQNLKSMGYLLLVATLRNDKNAVFSLLRSRKLAEFLASVYTSRSGVPDLPTEISEDVQKPISNNGESAPIHAQPSFKGPSERLTPENATFGRRKPMASKFEGMIQ
jgi:hypothetical protein